METMNFKEKSLLEKIAPVILIIGAIILVYFIFSKLKPSIQVNNAGVQNNPVQTTEVEVDTDFLMSPEFTKLKFIPDSPIFDEVTGDVPSGKADPFAPVK